MIELRDASGNFVYAEHDDLGVMLMNGGKFFVDIFRLSNGGEEIKVAVPHKYDAPNNYRYTEMEKSLKAEGYGISGYYINCDTVQDIVNYKKCKNCKHWDYMYIRRPDGRIGQCKYAKHFGDSILSNKGNIKIKEEFNDIKIFAIDGEDNAAAVLTDSEFGCIEFEGRLD